MDNNDPISSLLDQRLDEISAQPEQPATTGEKVIDDVLRMRDVENNVVLRQNSGTSAERQAEALRFSKQNNVPIGMAYRQLEDLQRSQIEASTEKMRYKYPAWSTLLSKEDFGPIAQDPQFAGDLQFLEETLTGFNKDSSSLGGAFMRGAYSALSGQAAKSEANALVDLQRLDQGKAPALSGFSPPGMGGPPMQLSQEDWRKKISGELATAVKTGAEADAAAAQYPASKAYREFFNPDTPISYILSHPSLALEIVAESTPASVPSMVGFAAGGPLGGGAMSADSEYGSAIREELNARAAEMKLDPTKPADVMRVWDAHGEDILRKAEIRGGVVGLFDGISFKVSSVLGAAAKPTLLRMFGLEVAGIASDAALGMAGELGAEALTQDEIDVKQVLAEGIGEVPGGAVQTAYSMAKEGVKVRAENNRQKLVTLGDRIRNSKAAKISPETVEAHAKALDESGAGAAMYAPVEAVVKLFQEEGYTPEQIEEKFPGISASLDEAQSGNADVQLKATDVVKMAQLKGWNDFTGDVRIGETLSANEAAKRDTEFQQLIEQTSAEDQRRAVSASIENEIAQQLIAAGTEQRAAQTQSKFAMSIYNTISQRTGIDVDTLRKRYPLTIRSENDGSMSFGIEGEQAGGAVMLDQATGIPDYRRVVGLDYSAAVNTVSITPGEQRTGLSGELNGQTLTLADGSEARVTSRGLRKIKQFLPGTADIRSAVLGRLADVVAASKIFAEAPDTEGNTRQSWKYGVAIVDVGGKKYAVKTSFRENVGDVGQKLYDLQGFEIAPVGSEADAGAEVGAAPLLPTGSTPVSTDARASAPPAGTQGYGLSNVNDALEFFKTGPRKLFQSAAPLQSAPMTVVGTGPGGRVLNRDLGQALTDRHMEEYGRALDPNDPEDYKLVLKSMQDDYAEQSAQPDNGEAWYSDDIAEAIRITSQIIPELADPVNRDLFLTIAALLSPQQKPVLNWENAILAMRGFLRDGTIPTTKPNGKQFGVASHTTGLQLLQHLITTKGLEEALLWVRSPVSGREMAEIRRDSGLFEPKDKLAGYLPSETNLNEEKLGIYMMGPKVGDFMQNSVGIDQNAVTVDLWLARTYNRLIGRLMDVAPGVAEAGGLADQVRGRAEREMIKRLVREAAAAAGLDPSAMQAALWYFEQRLYRNHGIRSDSQNFSGAAKTAAGKRGLDLSQRSASVGGPEGGSGAARGDAQESILFQAGDGGRQPARRGTAPLEGAPTVRGASGPDPSLVAVAEQYARDNGIDLRRQAEYVEVDEDRARRIAAAYEAMPHAPQDPAVKAAYDDLIRQTIAQYNALAAAGYKFYFYDPEGTDPYANEPGGFGNPWNAMRDLRANKRMAVFPTSDGFGTSDADVSDNPLLQITDVKWPWGSPDGELRAVTANDLFRAVHDAFGHGLEGTGFRARGEENAWQAHVRLFKGPAVGAITSETRGQNSWLNYGPNAETNQTAKVEDTVFADQKTGLMPPWTWEEGRAADEAPETGPSSSQTLYQNVADALANLDQIIGTPEFQSWFGKSVVVDENGKPLVVYHGSEQAGFTVFNTDGGSAKTRGTGAFFSNKLSNAMTYSGKRTLVNFPSKEEVLANPGKYGFTVEEDADGRAYVLDADGYQFDVEDGETVDQAMARAVDDYMTKDRLAGPEQANVPVFVKIEKPLIIDAQGLSWNNIGASPRFEALDPDGNFVGYATDEQDAIDQYGEGTTLGNQSGTFDDGQTTDDIVREARASGEYDGVIFKNVVDEGQYGWYDDPSDVYVVFYKNQIKSVQNQGTFNNEDPNILKQNARGYLRFPADRRAFEMTLTGKANLSTFVHESMHYFLEVMQDLVDKGEAPQQMIDDLAKLREWTKLEPGEKFSVRAHEMVARGMEAYVREGRAPDNALQDIFNRLRAWMVFIYKKATALNVELTDDVRGVFDRLVASDAAISEARTQLGWTKPLPQEALNLTDAEYARYVEAWQKASDEQSRELDERMMREAADARKELWQTETARRVDEEKAKLAETRGYKAWKLLTEGKGLEEFGRTELKIDPDSVPPEWRRDASGMTGEGGLPLELVAELLGFKSGENMLQLIAGAKFAWRDIPINVKRAMEAEHGHLDAAALADAANEAVIRPVAGVLLTEYRAMAAAAGLKTEPGLGEWMAATAKRKVQALTQRQLDPTRWRRAELKSAKEAAAAAAKGDKQKAALAKRQQLMAAAMYRATIEAEKRITTIQKKLVAFTKDDRRAKLGKAGESYLDAIDEILEGISFKNVSAKALQKQDRLAAFLKEAEENDLPVNVPEYLTAALGKRNYSTMTLEELEGVHDTVMSIWHLAKTKNELKMRAEKRDMEQALTEMEANAQKALGDPKVKDSFVKGWKDHAADKLQWIRAQLTKMEFMFGWLDGQPSGGLMHRLIYQPLADANHEEFKLLKRFNSTIFARMRNLPKEQKARLAAKRTFMGKDADGATVLAAALNLGNEANKRKLLEGYGWTEPQLMAEINAFMRKEDWELVQYIWDEIDTLWPKIEAVTKAATGLPPERVEALPVQTPFGQYRGGYYPVVYDPERTEQVFKNQQKADGLFTNNYLKPKLGDGFTKGRTNYSAPILLNLSVLPNHLASVVHYVTHYEAIAQANKITTHPRFANLVKTHMGNRFYREIRPWLQDIAQNQDTPAITRQEFFSNGLKHLRGGYSIAAMGFNVFTGFKQLYGVTTALDAMKARYWVSGISKSWLSPKAMQNWKFALENSAELKPLVEQVDRDIAMINQTYQKSLAGGAKDAAVRYAFSHIGYFQLAVNVATWHGAFEQSLAEGKTKEQAIDDADSVVRKTQSSGAVKDLSRVQRGSEATRMVSMFYSWFNVLYNRLDEIARETNSISDVPRAAKRIAILVFYSAILEETFGGLYEGITGGGDDDEEDRGFILSVLLRGADQIIGTLPLIRAFVKAESPAPAVDLFKDMQRIGTAAERLVMEGEMPTKSEGRAVAKVASALFHVPAKGVYDLVAEMHRVATGEEK